MRMQVTLVIPQDPQKHYPVLVNDEHRGLHTLIYWHSHSGIQIKALHSSPQSR